MRCLLAILLALAFAQPASAQQDASLEEQLHAVAAGYQGKIAAVSRRGLVPRSHADFDPAPVEASEVPGGNVRSIWRWLRRRSAEVGWRAAVDSLAAELGLSLIAYYTGPSAGRAVE